MRRRATLLVLSLPLFITACSDLLGADFDSKKTEAPPGGGSPNDDPDSGSDASASGERSTSRDQPDGGDTAGGNGITAIAAGAAQTCALFASGVVKCWGKNAVGELGDGTVIGGETPRDVKMTLAASWLSVSGSHACAGAATGVECWGSDAFGQAGNGTPAGDLPFHSTPVRVRGLSTGIIGIAVGSVHACALYGGGTIACWGHNEYGQLGANTGKCRFNNSKYTLCDQHEPIGVPSLAGGTNIFGGGNGTCFAKLGGGAPPTSDLRCWGGIQCLDEDSPWPCTSATPAQVVLASPVVHVSLGIGHRCVTTMGGSAYCWGTNGDGQLGTGSISTASSPTAVLGISATKIAVGAVHSCAIVQNGDIYCWGSNVVGAVGIGAGAGQPIPVVVPNLHHAIEITAGDRHTCALVEEQQGKRAVYCWGLNEFGQIGAPSSATCTFGTRLVPCVTSPMRVNGL